MGLSNTELVRPLHATATSSGQITTALLCKKPDMDRLVTCRLLMKLALHVGGRFPAVQQALENDAAT